MPNAVSDCGGSTFSRLIRQQACRTIAALIVALLAGLMANWDASGATALDRPAWKAEVWEPDAIYRGALVAGDLVLPGAAEAIDDVTSPRMALIKPAGAGPFPAIVLMHQCAGLNRAVAAWGRVAVSHGYVVLLVDSLGPRNVKSVCYGPQSGVN